MTNETSILIIEDTQGDYQKIYNFLTTEGYTSYPNPDTFPEFIKNVQNYLTGSDSTSKVTTSDYLNSFLKDLSPKLIILDIRLFPSEDDRSGLKFLKFLRAKYPYVPVLVLTIHTFEEVSPVFTQDKKANYFLNKILDNLSLSEKFFQTKLSPVITMLLYWHEISYSNRDIYDLLKSQEKNLIAYLDTRFGILTYDINTISTSLEDLRRHTDVLLRIAQYNLAKNDKKAGEIVDNFISEFTKITDVPKISANKTKLVEALKKSKENLRKIVKGEIVDKDIAALIKETFKEIIGADEDESVTKAILLTTCRAIGSAWKFYRT